MAEQEKWQRKSVINWKEIGNDNIIPRRNIFDCFVYYIGGKVVTL